MSIHDQPHRVAASSIDVLVADILNAVDGEKTGDAIVATLAATSRLMQGELSWEAEVKFVQSMLDFASTLVDDTGVAN